MARIETIFAKDVGGRAIPPILIRSRQLAWYEEEITWRCYNEHPRVKWVKIWFEDANSLHYKMDLNSALPRALEKRRAKLEGPFKIEWRE